MRDRLFTCVGLILLCGCGSYDEKPVSGPKPATPATSGTTPTSTTGAIAPPSSGPPGSGPPGSGPTDRTRLDKVGVKRVELSNVVGVYLNAKASINSRMMALNAHAVAEQFKGANGRYPNDYAELEVALKSEGKELPPLQPGYTYVFDPSDGQVYVEGGN